MPIYRLRCPRCDIVEERLVPMSERNDQKCPQCGKQMVVRVNVPVSHRFVGGKPSAS